MLLPHHMDKTFSWSELSTKEQSFCPQKSKHQSLYSDKIKFHFSVQEVYAHWGHQALQGGQREARWDHCVLCSPASTEDKRCALVEDFAGLFLYEAKAPWLRVSSSFRITSSCRGDFIRSGNPGKNNCFKLGYWWLCPPEQPWYQGGLVFQCVFCSLHRALGVLQLLNYLSRLTFRNVQ